MEQKIFIDAIEDYWTRYRLNIPEDPSQCVLVPSAFNYVAQRIVNRNLENSDRHSELVQFIQKISTLHGNLNYKKPVKDWKKFYTFPDPDDAKKYTLECGFSATRVVNFNEGAPLKLIDEIVHALEHADYRTAKLHFLTGTTGVGKTTFLKYFSKLYRQKLFNASVIISRVRFRDIQDFKKENTATNTATAFRQTIINCLVRDICACTQFEPEITDDGKIVDGTLINLKEKIKSALDETLLRTDELDGWDVNKVIDEFERDEDTILDLPYQQKCKLIEMLRDDINFCIVLDGFDAMRPEEIALFGDLTEADFFNCLSTVIRNAFARDNSAGRCLKKINKHFLVAARNVTIAQLKDEIEGETDNNQIIFEDFHVIGTSISKLLKNRLEVHLFGNISKAKIKRLQQGVELSIDYIMELLRTEHPTIEEGRFIDLFNHNIREKVRFLADFIDLLTYKIELKYRSDYLDVPDEVRKKLTINKLLDYFHNPKASLGLELYEIQKLLILNKSGFFKNFFHHNSAGKLIPESHKGQFDNLFNYENRVIFQTEHEEQSDKFSYEYARDPLLEKFFILYRLSLEEALAEPVLREWFHENFKFQSCRDTTLKQLIRNGTIDAEYVDDVIYLNITPKGRFIYKELLGVSVYLEHIVLNLQVPHFISKLIIRPKDPSRREWGRNSISNIVVLLKYVEEVINMAVSPTSKDLKIQLQKVLVKTARLSVLDSFQGMIAEGLEFEMRRDYATDLAVELRAIGVKI